MISGNPTYDRVLWDLEVSLILGPEDLEIAWGSQDNQASFVLAGWTRLS